MKDTTVMSGEVIVFQVRLRCEAAPKIGCGLRAKPVLQDLACAPGIREAQLNQAGNLIAAVTTAPARGSESTDAALAVFRRHRVAAEMLRGERLENALSDFASRSGWHHAADVDRLSEEEARIIAARFVARLRAKGVLPKRRAEALETAVAEACAHELIRNPSQSAMARKRRLASAALAAASTRLDAPAYVAFVDAVRLGHRPLPSER